MNQTLTLTGISGIQYTVTPANMIIIHNNYTIPIAASQLPVEDVLMIANCLRSNMVNSFTWQEVLIESVKDKQHLNFDTLHDFLLHIDAQTKLHNTIIKDYNKFSDSSKI